MAFGDGHNDIDMLQFVGTGILWKMAVQKQRQCVIT